MLSSMTGYGDAQGALDGIELTVEIRCLNNRYYKPNIKLPEEMAYLEPTVDTLLRKAVVRGTLVYTLRIRPGEDSAQVRISHMALRSFVQELREVERDLGFEGVNIDLASLLQVPGMTRPVELSQLHQERLEKLVVELTEKALRAMVQMRQREGQVMQEDLLKQSEIIRGRLGEITKIAPTVVKTYHAKLAQRAAELLSGSRVTVKEDDLAREVAIFSERCDISEEIVRLGSHLDLFENVCKEKAQAGRRLDFVAQEMLRESNTIGAKASDSAIGAAVVDIKTAVDRIKEQVQNIE